MPRGTAFASSPWKATRPWRIWAPTAPSVRSSNWANSTPDDVAVQLITGPVGPNDELIHTTTAAMDLTAGGDAAGTYRYAGTFQCESAGRYGFTVRVVPSHPDLLVPVDLGLIGLPPRGAFGAPSSVRGRPARTKAGPFRCGCEPTAKRIGADC